MRPPVAYCATFWGLRWLHETLGSPSYSGLHHVWRGRCPPAAVTLRISRQPAGNRRYRTPAELGVNTGESQGAQLAADGVPHFGRLVGCRTALQYGGSLGQRENGLSGLDPHRVPRQAAEL